MPYLKDINWVILQDRTFNEYWTVIIHVTDGNDHLGSVGESRGASILDNHREVVKPNGFPV